MLTDVIDEFELNSLATQSHLCCGV